MNSSNINNSLLFLIAILTLTYCISTDKTKLRFLHKMVNQFRRALPSVAGSAMDDVIMKRGGFVSGLVNDGNTCFMNSVLQSLASSKELNKFLDDFIDDEDGNNSGNKKFSITFKALFDKLNAKYYRDRKYFRPNALLKTMESGPNKNILLGYDQEDAQEFFQQLLSQLEKDIKHADANENENDKENEDPKEKDNRDKEPLLEKDLPTEALLNQEKLDKVGTVFIPTEQIEPNFMVEKNKDKSDKYKHYYSPFKLVTPLDGITAERIGCLNCGENGGIRYSVFSGLSLNLPNENIGKPLKLTELLNKWIEPEIIEGVECNRCALEAVRSHLLEQLEYIQSGEREVPQKLIDAIRQRIQTVEETLLKPVIDDEDYKKLHTENMVRKCSKSKQVIISRPPPLLSIHINRSVFDPRTYMIRKNNSRVLFKSRINLDPWCCSPTEINLDARLPMSKKEKIIEESSEEEIENAEYYANVHKKFVDEFEDSGEDESNDEQYYSRRQKDVSGYDPLNGQYNDMEDSSEFSSSGEEVEEMEQDVEYIEETDALGNTIRRRIAKEIVNNDESNIEKDDLEYPMEQEENETTKDEMNQPTINKRPAPLSPPPHRLSVPKVSTVPASPLTYSLRSVIIHYGTHNYGHYIAFRKYRGCWWRISDENVYVVDEAEVLSTPGVFMLFYEYDYDEATGKLKDDIEEFEESNIEIVDKMEDNDKSYSSSASSERNDEASTNAATIGQ